MFNKIDNFDKALFLFLNNLGAEPWDSFWIFVSNTFWMFCLLTPIILFYTFYNHGKKAVYLIFILLFCFCVTDLISLSPAISITLLTLADCTVDDFDFVLINSAIAN